MHKETYNGYVTLSYLDGLKINGEVIDVEFDNTLFELSDFGSEVVSVQENYFDE